MADEAVADFVIEVKRPTHAAGDQPRSPLLAGSRQREYTAGALLYRDIYFGSAYFVGQDSTAFPFGP